MYSDDDADVDQCGEKCVDSQAEKCYLIVACTRERICQHREDDTYKLGRNAENYRVFRLFYSEICDRYRHKSDACIGREDRYQVGYCGDGGGDFFIGYVALYVDHYRLQNEVGYKGECYVDQNSEPEKRGAEQRLGSCFFNRFILCHS